MPSTGIANVYQPPAANTVRRMDLRDIIRVAVAAGFRGRDLEIAVAIALASSNGEMDLHDTSNVNATWGPSVGLWRIRTQTAQSGKGGPRDINAVSEALGNARAAFALYQARKAKGQKGFEDWPVFTTGQTSSYTRHLSEVRAAMASLGGEKAVVPEVTARLQAGTPIYYGGPPSSVPAGGGTPRPGEAGFRPEGAQPPADPTSPVPPPTQPKPPTSVSSPAGPAARPATIGAGGAALGGGGTTTVTNAATTHPGTTLTGAALDDYIRQTYGAMAWALSNPELGPILRQAAAEGWDDGRLQAKIESTNWWKTHSAAQREVAVLKETDPAEFARHIDTTAAALRDRATQLGIPLSIERSRQIAETSVTLGWDDNETNDALAAEFHYDPKVGLKGQAATMAAGFRQQSKAFGVPVNDGLIGSWVQGILTGSMTEDDVATYFKDQAKSRYPFMASQIDGGVTPEQWFSPYVQAAAQTLEMNPADLDINNPLVAAAVNQIDPKTGERRPMGLWDYQTYLRARPEWERTSGARKEAASLVGFLEQNMGLRV